MSTLKINESALFNSDNGVFGGSFFKFNKVGDKVYGELIGVDEMDEREGKDAEGKPTVFRAQKVYTIKQTNGEIAKVGISLNRVNVINNIEEKREISKKLAVGFKLDAIIPNEDETLSAIKSINSYVMILD